MKLLSLGTSDIKISPIIMGTWQAGKEMWAGIDDNESIGAIKAETRSWKWTLFTIGLLAAISFGVGIVVYQIVSRIVM